MVRLAALIMVVVAIGALWALTADGEPPEGGLDGSVFASGSSTVEPITLIVAEQLHERDATFGYRSSSLPEWVEEKTGGRVSADEVLRVTLDDLRGGGPGHTARLLSSLSGGRTAVVDAVCDDDLRVLALALAEAETNGTRLLYRVGPSFVRARAGQAGRTPLTPADLRALV